MQAVEHYQTLLTYVKSAVTRNYSEKSINNMLDFIEKNAEDQEAQKCMERFYSLTLESFQSTNNERLWLKTNIKLARLWLEKKDYRTLTEKLKELHRACQDERGNDDPAKGTYSLEIYALEIQMLAETRNNKRLKVSPANGGRTWWSELTARCRHSISGHSKSNRRCRIPRSRVSSANAAGRCI